MAAAPPALSQDSEAQDVSPNTSVIEQFNSRVGSVGLRMGGFTLYPTLNIGVDGDDNIFALPSETEEDVIGVFTGSASLNSNWAVHSASLFAQVNRRQYVNNTEESSTDYRFSASGTYEATPRIRFSAGGGYSLLTEARIVTQTATGTDQPIQYSILDANASATFAFTRITTTAGVLFSRSNFEDGVSSINGDEIDQDFRDADSYTAFARSLFRVRPAVQVFTDARVQRTEYDSARPGTSIFQDSEGYVLSGGVAFDINKVARGEISGGYQRNDFSSPEFTDVAGTNVDAEVEYFLSGLTTITLEANRSIQNTNELGVDGSFFRNSAGLQIDHELLRQLIISVSARYEVDEFQGTDRRDNFLSARIAAQYLIGRRILAGIAYTFSDLNSVGDFRRDGYQSNSIGVSIEIRG